MGFLKDEPLTVRQGGWFLVVLGSLFVVFGFLLPALRGQPPSYWPQMPLGVFGIAFLGTGLPFAACGETAMPRFGHPQRPESWPRVLGITLALSGLLIFALLRWLYGA